MTIEILPTLSHARDQLSSDRSRSLVDWYIAMCEETGASVLGRHHFDPTANPRLLPSLVILDITEPRRPVFRLAGTRYVSFLGADPTGMSYLDFVPSTRRDEVIESYVHCHTHLCAMISHTVAVNDRGREQTMEIINLPLWKGDPESGALHFLVLVSPRGSARWAWDDECSSQFVRIEYRAFVDLGNGTPGSFRGQTLQ